MFRNYLIVAVRNLLRQKLYAFINVFGLAIGLACCILIFLYVRHEWQYDAFHENADRIFRVIVRETRPDGSVGFSTLHPTVSRSSAGRGISRNRSAQADSCVTGLRYHTTRSSFANPSAWWNPTFWRCSHSRFLLETLRRPCSSAGRCRDQRDRRPQALREPGRWLYSGDRETAVGWRSRTLPSQGVMRDVPETSSLKFSLLIPIGYHENYGTNSDWLNAKASMYVQLVEEQDIEALEAEFPSFAEKHLVDRIEFYKTHGRVRKTDDGFLLRIQPLRDVYLNSKVRRNSYEARGNVFYSYVLSGLALLVLAIACINYMTLTAGRLVGRAREVGMRKVLGAQRMQLVEQFLGEAMFLSLVALAMGIALAELFLPVFNDLARKNLSIPYLDSWGTMVALKGIVGIAGLVAGSYPAAVLLRIQPVEVLKGQKGIGGRNLGSRVLMVVQYGLTITLMISAAMMFQQLRYVKEKDLGYREEQVVVVPAMVRNADTVSNRYKAEISRSPWILNATISDRAFTTGANTKRLESESGERVQARIVQIDHLSRDPEDPDRWSEFLV